MNRRRRCLALAVAAGALGPTACIPLPIGARRPPPALLIGGASAMQPLATALSRAFMRQHGELSIVVERGGSLPAYIAASRGVIDVAAMTRALSDSEDDAGAHHFLIARAHTRVVVHRAVRIGVLTHDQVVAVLSGEIENWRDVGGPDRPVTVYVRPRGDIARQSAEQVVLGGGDFTVNARECPDEVVLLATAAADRGAIACLDAHTTDAARAGTGAGQLTALAVGGVAATPSTVLSGRYPYTHSYHLLLHGAPGGVRSAFVRFVRSADGQAIVSAQGLLSVC